MKRILLFIVSAVGVALAVISAYVYAQQPRPQPPVFNPASNPYPEGIYANGIIESAQAHGANVNIYPEVSGPIIRIFVAEGSQVHEGDPLVMVDDSVQRATAEQLRAQASAAQAVLDELRHQPRPENLAVVAAQVENAKAGLKNAQDQLDKQEHSYQINPRSISKDALDNARNATMVADTNLNVVQKQYGLTKAGAWKYDIINQQRQVDSLSKAAAAAEALLAKYVLHAPVDGVVMLIQSAVGSYVSPQGAYNPYTQGFSPLVVMGTPQQQLEVRAYIDEILVHRLADPSKIQAQMSIRGTNVKVPLTFSRIQPYVSPKIELSDQRLERVDVRVLPVIFRFDPPKDVPLYPGQLVDVYVGGQ